MLSCKKHKSPSLFMCLDVGCSQPRFSCGKCLDLHTEHDQHVITLSQDQNSAEKIGDKNDAQFVEISRIINTQDGCFEMVKNVFKNLERISIMINDLKKQLEEVIAVHDNEQSVLKINDALVCQKSDSQDIIEEIMKTITTQNNDNLRKFQKHPGDFYDDQLLCCMNALQKSRDIISSFVDKNKVKNNEISSNNNQAIAKNIAKDIQSQSSSKVASIPDETNSSSTLQSSLNSIFNKNTAFQKLINPFFKTKPQFSELSKTIDPNTPYQLEFDGSSKGNPGEAGAGFVLKEKNSGKILKEYAIPVGIMTNNQSEYLAAIYGLYVSLKVGVKDLTLQGDSMLVICQLQGSYKVKSENIASRYELAKQLTKLFKSCTFQHVKREKNYLADKLSNQALTSVLN